MLLSAEGTFDLKKRRNIVLTFEVSMFLFWEIGYAAITYGLYKAVWESNCEKNFFKVASDILTTNICIFTWLQFSWYDIQYIYNSYTEVRKYRISPCM